MSGDRNVGFGRDAAGNAILTGNNNLAFVLVGTEKIPEQLLSDLKTGRLNPSDIPGAVADALVVSELAPTLGGNSGLVS